MSLPQKMVFRFCIRRVSEWKTLEYKPLLMIFKKREEAEELLRDNGTEFRSDAMIKWAQKKDSSGLYSDRQTNKVLMES